MKLPSGHAKRLFIGFTCCISFLVVFALLIAHNTEAVSSNYSSPGSDQYPLTIAIPTPHPQETIRFYQKLGFKETPGLSRSLDVVCMEKSGTPYKLEIYHNRFSEEGPGGSGVSGMSFPVISVIDTVSELSRKGLTFSVTNGKRDGVRFASLNDPNGIQIKLFER